MTPAEIGTILDAAARAKAAQDWLDANEGLVERMRDVRDKAIVQMRVEGWSQRRAAAHVGVSPGRVAQIDAEQGVHSERVATLGSRGTGVANATG